MKAKEYFRRMGQSDASRGVKLGVHKMRHWERWAFDAYVMGWINQNMGLTQGKPKIES